MAPTWTFFMPQPSNTRDSRWLRQQYRSVLGTLKYWGTCGAKVFGKNIERPVWMFHNVIIASLIICPSSIDQLSGFLIWWMSWMKIFPISGIFFLCFFFLLLLLWMLWKKSFSMFKWQIDRESCEYCEVCGDWKNVESSWKYFSTWNTSNMEKSDFWLGDLFSDIVGWEVYFCTRISRFFWGFPEYFRYCLYTRSFISWNQIELSHCCANF